MKIEKTIDAWLQLISVVVLAKLFFFFILSVNIVLLLFLQRFSSHILLFFFVDPDPFYTINDPSSSPENSLLNEHRDGRVVTYSLGIELLQRQRLKIQLHSEEWIDFYFLLTGLRQRGKKKSWTYEGEL